MVPTKLAVRWVYCIKIFLSRLVDKMKVIFFDIQGRRIKKKARESESDVLVTFTCSKSTIETSERCEICSKLTIKTPERRH